MLRHTRTVAEKQSGGDPTVRACVGPCHLSLRLRLTPSLTVGPPRHASTARGAPLVDELHDGDGDGAEQEDVYETFLAQDEFSQKPRGEERRGEQT